MFCLFSWGKKLKIGKLCFSSSSIKASTPMVLNKAKMEFTLYVTSAFSLQEWQLSLTYWNNSNVALRQHCNSGVCIAEFRQWLSITKINSFIFFYFSWVFFFFYIYMFKGTEILSLIHKFSKTFILGKLNVKPNFIPQHQLNYNTIQTTPTKHWLRKKFTVKCQDTNQSILNQPWIILVFLKAEY